jgi:hypothetical protein
MLKLIAIHGLVKLISHGWNDPSMAWLRIAITLAVLAYVLWLVCKFVLYVWGKFHAWRQRSEMPYHQNSLSDPPN